MLRKLGCWLASLTGAFALLALAGCTVPTEGITGISVDEAGNWVIVLAWSCHKPDVVIVYHDDPSHTADPDVVDAKVEVSAAEASGSAGSVSGKAMILTVDVFHPPAGSIVVKAAQPLDASVTYAAFGGTKNNSWATTAVDFRLSDIAALSPGQVLYQDGDSKIVASMEDFQKAATHRC